MRERLRRAGLRPISAVVDVTNYVMLELGQPMHAYDRREIDGGIVVRRARAGETLRLLDGREISMDESVLVIADHSKALGLAGVMGGDRSGIDGQTTDVLLEVAWFVPDAIAGRGRRYGLVTDASQRFERGVDPTLQERALERATRLILDCAGGDAGPLEVAELADELPEARTVRLRPARARRVIGAEIADADMRRHLQSLGHDRVRRVGRPGRVTPPSWRFDIAIEEDLVEEVARLHGFDRVPETHQTAAVVDAADPGDADRRGARGRHPGRARLSRGDHLQLRRSRRAGAVLARGLGAARSRIRFPRISPRCGCRSGRVSCARCAKISVDSNRACACSRSAGRSSPRAEA